MTPQAPSDDGADQSARSDDLAQSAAPIALDAACFEPLERELPAGFVEARLSAHWAAQAVAAVGTTHAPAREDFGHTNLGWVRALGALCSRAVGARRLRAGLRLADFHLLVVDDGGARAQLALAACTLERALGWLRATLEEADPTLSLPLVRPQHDLPDHAVASGAPFAAPAPAALAELSRWFEDAEQLTQAVAAAHGAPPPRCWPHHFDLATLIELEEARSVGVGMSPGDGSYAAPYFYVTPWPYPASTADLPALPHGHWHTEGWTGAVLHAADAATVAAFVNAAIAALL